MTWVFPCKISVFIKAYILAEKSVHTRLIFFFSRPLRERAYTQKSNIPSLPPSQNPLPSQTTSIWNFTESYNTKLIADFCYLKWTVKKHSIPSAGISQYVSSSWCSMAFPQAWNSLKLGLWYFLGSTYS